MRFFTARRLALAALVPALFLVCVVPGCSNESEGERCGDGLGPDDSDCASGLVCVDSKHLLNALDGTFRCCYPGQTTVNDSRCLPATDVTTGGTGGSAGSAGTGGVAGSTTAGTGGDTADAGDVTAAGAGGN